MKRVKISPGFCALVCVMAWLSPKLCLCFLGALILHELGHLIALLCCKAPVEGISLCLNGAVIRARITGYRQEICCALAGPAASILAGAACIRLAPSFAVINLLLAAVNLLPLYPMDGGRCLRSALRLHIRADAADRVMCFVTYGTCGVLMILTCWLTVERQAGLWPVFAALALLWRVGEASLRER